MNILIFGKDGQLGKAFHVLLDSLLPSIVDKPNIQFIGRAECDLSDTTALNSLLNQFHPQLIVNASAYTAVDKAETEGDLAFAVNARAPGLMAQYAAQHGATFLHYSTDYVFDGEKYGFYLEDDMRNPLGVYGKSKAAGEEVIVQAFATSSLDNAAQYAIFRTSWVYGEGSNFIRTILRLAKDRDELKVIEDQYGVPTSAHWLAQVSLGLVMNAKGCLSAFPSGIYHAVPAGETTWHGYASHVIAKAKVMKPELDWKVADIAAVPTSAFPTPAIRPLNSRLCTNKLQQDFGLVLPHWSQGVNRMLVEIL